MHLIRMVVWVVKNVCRFTQWGHKKVTILRGKNRGNDCHFSHPSTLPWKLRGYQCEPFSRFLRGWWAEGGQPQVFRVWHVAQQLWSLGCSGHIMQDAKPCLEMSVCFIGSVSARVFGWLPLTSACGPFSDLDLESLRAQNVRMLTALRLRTLARISVSVPGGKLIH